MGKQSEFYKVAHGVKLYERKCKMCPLTFWVPKSSPQLTCGQFCLSEMKNVKGGFYARIKEERVTKKQKGKYKIKESDYED